MYGIKVKRGYISITTGTKYTHVAVPEHATTFTTRIEAWKFATHMLNLRTFHVVQL
jgi:hypothetical protein